jgi:glutamate decarboxylase
VVIQRVLVRQGVSRDLADLLLQNMREAIEYFEQRPVQVSLTEKEASGFHH